MFFLAIGLLFIFSQQQTTHRAENMSPQGDPALFTGHSPHTTIQNLNFKLQQQFKSTSSLPLNLHNPLNVIPFSTPQCLNPLPAFL